MNELPIFMPEAGKMKRVPKPGWRWSLILPACVLATAVSMQGIQFVRRPVPATAPHLAQVVPTNLSGWEMRDVPLGASEFLSNEVEKVLNYDEAINREFSRGSENFSIYVAYWSAGKMPAQLVASHTPDRCWTENGWHCLDMKFKQSWEIDGKALQPAEWRLFEPPLGGAPTHVLYWHLVAGRTYDYGNRFSSMPDPVLWWKEVVREVVFGRREQYFIRVTSNERLENLWGDPGFAEVLRNLARLGLEAGKPVQAGNQ